jgi:hypothetical protein
MWTTTTPATDAITAPLTAATAAMTMEEIVDSVQLSVSGSNGTTATNGRPGSAGTRPGDRGTAGAHASEPTLGAHGGQLTLHMSSAVAFCEVVVTATVTATMATLTATSATGLELANENYMDHASKRHPDNVAPGTASQQENAPIDTVEPDCAVVVANNEYRGTVAIRYTTDTASRIHETIYVAPLLQQYQPALARPTLDSVIALSAVGGDGGHGGNGGNGGHGSSGSNGRVRTWIIPAWYHALFNGLSMAHSQTLLSSSHILERVQTLFRHERVAWW